jgi:hypothetical protein
MAVLEETELRGEPDPWRFFFDLVPLQNPDQLTVRHAAKLNFIGLSK